MRYASEYVKRLSTAHRMINWCNFVKLYSNVLCNDNYDVEFPSKDKLTGVITECFDIICDVKNDNWENERYKNQIILAAEKINNLKIEVSENTVIITDEKLNELKNLLQFLQESSTTLEDDTTKVSREIDEILDLILTKGMQLEQYDQIIEKQNTVIVKMKNILNTVEKI